MKIGKIVFDIIANIICNREITVDEISESDFEYLLCISNKHDLSHILWNYIEHLNYPKDNINIKKFQKSQSLAMYRYVQNENELNTLIEIFENECIPFIPLKGSVLRNYYPEPWMRTSCDIDLLVKEQDIERAVKLLVEKYGYTYKERGLHDISLYSQNNIHLELHFDLTSEDAYVSVLSKVWDNCFLAENRRYQYIMNNEFFAFYHITHMAEHFVRSGCGIRPFLDLWVINKKIGYDETKVIAMLEEISLSDFYKNSQKLIKVWFEDDEHTDLTLKMEYFIIGSGIYGTTENKIAMNQTENGGRFKYIWNRVFLPYDKLKRLYPKTEQCVILVPFYQIKRWFNFLFNKDKKRAAHELKANFSVYNEKINSMDALSKELGLK